jgi:transcriptional regulator with XRE-family HTH domain
MPLGDRIKELRLKNRESLQQLADAIGASKAHIWEIESNRSKNPSIDLLQRLAEHFKTSVAFLIDESQGDLSLADQFFRKNSQKLSAMTDADFQFFEQMLNRISDGNKP